MGGMTVDTGEEYVGMTRKAKNQKLNGQCGRFSKSVDFLSVRILKPGQK